MGTREAGAAARVLIAILAAAALHGQTQETTSQPPRAPHAQDPRPPLPYEEETVSYPNPQAGGVTLYGTLTKPRTDKPAKAVLLLSGAGPQDRDETTAGHKPFLVIADYLTRRGLAVLRVDDRGTGQSTGAYEGATIEDFASDARASFDYLRSRSEVDKAHTGLLGHGEGAIVASMLAADNPDVSFLVLLGGTAVPGESVLLEQTARAQTAANLPPEQIEADARLGKLLYDMVRAGKTQEEMRNLLAQAPDDYAPFVGHWRQQIPKLDSPWLRFFLGYDPSKALAKVKCPVLALWGAKDMQVDPEQNASATRSALSHAHNRDYKVKVLPGLNYLFQKANTGLAFEYAGIAETISPAVLETIGEFVTKTGS